MIYVCNFIQIFIKLIYAIEATVSCVNLIDDLKAKKKRFIKKIFIIDFAETFQRLFSSTFSIKQHVKFIMGPLTLLIE